MRNRLVSKARADRAQAITVLWFKRLQTFNRYFFFRFVRKKVVHNSPFWLAPATTSTLYPYSTLLRQPAPGDLFFQFINFVE
jgi:hypothetical protein